MCCVIDKDREVERGYEVRAEWSGVASRVELFQNNAFLTYGCMW